MPALMRVELATLSDLPAIRAAYAHGRAMQRAQASAVWPDFPDAAIGAEIGEGRLQLVFDEDLFAGVFTVAYDDGAIWAERECGAHVYLHRIARAADYAGRDLIGAVLAWTRAHARTIGRAGLRMDTWADNHRLIAYYERLGFVLVDRRRIGPDPRLLPHYHGAELALLEERGSEISLALP